MAGSDSRMDKPQRGRPKRAELLDVNITGVQSINTERASSGGLSLFSRGGGGSGENCVQKGLRFMTKTHDKNSHKRSEKEMPTSWGRVMRKLPLDL